MKQLFLFLIISSIFLVIDGTAQPSSYPWLDHVPTYTIAQIPLPNHYHRVETEPATFASWLRHLPLKNNNPPVYLYHGEQKGNQNVHFAVVDIDVGDRDLQQCADAVMRLRAEYLYSRQKYEHIHFNFTSGDRADWLQWRDGYRPQIKGNSVSWWKTTNKDTSYANFRMYLNTVFIYAGSYSLSLELNKEVIENVDIGDVFIQGGFPGHAIIVVDMAIHEKTNQKIILLAQSYMPAQDIHVLKNLNNTKLNPWYQIKENDKLYTPEWTFDWNDLKTF